jgi:glycosyltransferase involved in cell wall biosynthesis
MRILRITSEFPPPFNGLGPGPHQLTLAQVRRGHKVTVISKFKDNTLSFDHQLPFGVIRLKAMSDVLFSIKAAAYAKEMACKDDVDMIHCHGLSTFGPLLLAEKGRLGKIPIVTSIHCVRRSQRARNKGVRPPEGFFTSILSGNFHVWESIMEKVILDNSLALIAVSNGVKDELVAGYGIAPGKICFSGNGVDTALFSPGSGKSPISKVLNLLWVGRFSGHKGETDLLTMASMLVNRNIVFQLMMIGEGRGAERFQKAVTEMGLHKHIVLLPYVSPEVLSGHYQNAHLFLLPSRSEGMPKVVLEAMSSGCPVVLSDIPGCRELVEKGKNGFLVPPGSPDCLVDIIRRFVDEPGLAQRMGAESRRMVERDYSWDAVAGRVEECYRAVSSE